MERGVISIKDAAKQLGCDRSNLLKRLKKEGYRIGTMYDDEARGQKVSVIKVTDFEEIVRLHETVQW